jgi:hypothetical protein
MAVREQGPKAVAEIVELLFSQKHFMNYEGHDKLWGPKQLKNIPGQVHLIELNSEFLTWRKLLLNWWYAHNICSINILIR